MVMKKDVPSRVVFKTDTTENWAKAKNFIPLKGEPICYQDYDVNGKPLPPRYKSGDGETKVNDLPFETGAIKAGEGKNAIVLNDNGAQAVGYASSASGFFTLAGVKGWVITGYSEGETIINISDPNQTLTSLLDLSRTIYYNVRLSVSHYDMWGIVQSYERSTEDGNIVLLTISNSIPESYIEEALPDRNTITFYTPFLAEEIDDELTSEQLEASVKDSLTYKLLTSGDVTIGEFTSAQGFLSYAFKMMAHAEGYFTNAIGRYSHAEGRNTISGYSAHAEGYGAQALGLQSHAEGNYTLAKNYAAHAEGDQTEALGHGSHAEGTLYQNDITKKTKAVANAAHAEGQGTVANGMGSHTEGGLTQTGGEYGGEIYGGSFAHAEGFETKALMARSHAEGEGTKTFGQASHAEGKSTEATGEGAHAEGRSTKADGSGAHAEGSSTKAFGHSAHAEGFGTATGLEKVASHNGTTTYGYFAHAEGDGTWAKGAGSHAEGGKTEAHEAYSHAEGSKTKALQLYSHAEGQETQADGAASHAEGNQTYAWDVAAHAEGRMTQALGKGTHAEGSSAKVNNAHSGHAEGYGTLVGKIEGAFRVEDNGTQGPGYFAHAEGTGTQAEGTGSHAEGRLTVASGNYSHAAGLGTKATAEAQTVVGKYNKEDNKALFIVGVGTGDASNQRSNAFTVGNDGTEDYITLGEEKLSETELSDLKEPSDWNETDSASPFYIKNKPNIVSYVTGELYEEDKYLFTGVMIGTGNTSQSASPWQQGVHKNSLLIGGRNVGYTSATGDSSLTVGGTNGRPEEPYALKASGNFSLSAGLGTQAIANTSQALGVGTHATIEGQMAIGKYNKEDNNALFIIGNGTDYTDESRSNAFAVDLSGHATLGADPEEAMHAVTKQYLDNAFGDMETALDAILAIQNELLPPSPSLITFTNRDTGKTYTAIEGMTWGEWCDSEYNTDGYYISTELTGQEMVVDASGSPICEWVDGSPSMPLDPSQIVKPNGIYGGE